MNEITLVISVWVLISVSYVMTGAGFLSLARTLTPFGWPGYVLGSGYLIFGIVGAASVVVAIVRSAGGANPAFEGIGYVGYFRIVAGLMFSCFQATLVCWTAFRARTLTPVELQTVLAAARAFAQLRKTVDAVRN